MCETVDENFLYDLELGFTPERVDDLVFEAR